MRANRWHIHLSIRLALVNLEVGTGGLGGYAGSGGLRALLAPRILIAVALELNYSLNHWDSGSRVSGKEEAIQLTEKQ